MVSLPRPGFFKCGGEMSFSSGPTPLFTPRGGGSSGGGGGSSLLWSESANAPVKYFENNCDVYLYQNGEAQELYTAVRIPSSYSASSPVKLLIEWYCGDSSGNVLIRAQSTLIRAGTDAITSTTNQRTTTNSAATLSGGTVNIPQKVILDVTSTTGTVNSVAVSAGDLLIIRLYRDTDTATGDAKFVLGSGEMTFS